jgi:Ran GTPase-activating protein (RanGAP) involved in mRNA processing and transport
LQQQDTHPIHYYQGWALKKPQGLALLEKANLTNNIGLTPPLLDTIHHMTNLQHLDLSNNALPMVRYFYLKKLTFLALRGNQIRTLGPRLFDGLPALTTLDLGDNMITKVGPKALQGTIFFADGLMGVCSLTQSQ